jgi:divalent metal cation (Fe/Co/Zn/Cd) transporter
MKVKKADFIVSMLLLALTAFFLYQTSLLHASNVPNEMEPKFFPYICLIATGIFSLALLISSFITGNEQKEAPAAGDTAEREAQFTIREAMIYFGMILLALIGVYFIGFPVAMTIGVGLILLFTGWKPLKAGVFAVVTVAAVVVIFQVLIHIPLPKGILF